MRLLLLLLLMALSNAAKRPDDSLSKIKYEVRPDMNLRASKADMMADALNRPVPFGHIYKDGFEDPNEEMKQPIDLLDLDMRLLHDGPIARKLIEEHHLSHQKVVINKNVGDPIDTIRVEPADDNKDETEKTAKKDTVIPYWDLAALHQHNLAHPPIRNRSPQRRADRRTDKPPVIVTPNYEKKAKLFADGSFGVQGDPDTSERRSKENFTTCDEFGRDAQFHPNDIVNLDWVPFYIWTAELMGRVTVARVHRFTYPLKKVVEEYKKKYSPYMNKTIDWDQPKLYLKDDTDLLLIAADRKGLFEGIPHHDLPDYVKRSKNAKIPTLTLRMKIVDPYLAIMYCNHQYANIMAVVGSEPKTKHAMELEAKVLKIKGPGFPVKRDLIMEGMEARAKKMEQMEKTSGKFITLEDQMSPARIKHYRTYNFD